MIVLQENQGKEWAMMSSSVNFIVIKLIYDQSCGKSSCMLYVRIFDQVLSQAWADTLIGAIKVIC